jgi:indolepyruvate ferredoxin oxidoreductase
MTAPFRPPLADYQMSDRYTRTEGRVFLTGTQALVRILLDQARRDRAAGLNTGGLVSGYRGSPLGALDLEIWRASDRIKESRIEFLPAVNEDLGATAILGSQQVETNPNAQVQGVFGMWYGKGPGVDRSGDALKHGNAYGSSAHGGVLVVAGDDHGCVSSSMPHQSDAAFLAWFMPVLNPANVAEFLPFGEWGYALSRFSGLWVGFKAVSDVVESGMSVDLLPDRQFKAPDFAPPPGGLHYRWPDLPGFQIEDRMEAKKQAALAFADANPIDQVIHDIPRARFGFITTGKAHLDLMEALRLLDLDRDACARLGIDIYKVGMVWPLAWRRALDFVAGKDEVMVIEEKRGIIESQLKEYFYDWDGEKPRHMVGKRDEQGHRLVPWTGELSPRQLLPLVARRLHGLFPEEDFPARAEKVLAVEPKVLNVPGAVRTPYFCSGCPHNTSTRVPEGSKALAGIGCHFMASWMNRETTSLIQMGGEGVNWAASSKFTGNDHVFQNLGEGTWYHSGSMAIRQAIAAGANITYKILYNDAVAMTGGQPVDGPVSVQSIAAICRAEGVERIALVSDDIGKFHRADFPAGTTFHDRRELDHVQREIRTIKGVSVLIYEQACATEKRRRRKRGKLEDPQKFVMINELVCEGCGDCSRESNCLSVEPIDTEFGPKRRINQSNCNKDYSCLNGFCPSFVTIEGAPRMKPKPKASDAIDAAIAKLPEPDLPMLEKPYDLLVTGVGGTGVVTVGALISMAAHLEGRGSSVLDFTGFAQKFGPVLSYLRLAPRPEDIQQVRTDRASADATDRLRSGGVDFAEGLRLPAPRHPRRGDADRDADGRYRPQPRRLVADPGAPAGARIRRRRRGRRARRGPPGRGDDGRHGLCQHDPDGLCLAIGAGAGVARRARPGDRSEWRGHRRQPPRLRAGPAGRRRSGAAGRSDAPEAAGRVARKADHPPRGVPDRLSGPRLRATLPRPARPDPGAGRRGAVAGGSDEPLQADGGQGRVRGRPPASRHGLRRAHRARIRAGRARELPPGAAPVAHRHRPSRTAQQAPLPRLGDASGLRGARTDEGAARHPLGLLRPPSRAAMERDLLDWYEGLLTRAATEAPGALPLWREILSAPMGIRGYGPVKEEAAKKVRAEVAAKLHAPREAAA